MQTQIGVDTLVRIPLCFVAKLFRTLALVLDTERLQLSPAQETALFPKTIPIFGLRDLRVIVMSGSLQEIAANATHILPPFHIQFVQDITHMKLCSPFLNSQ